MKKGKALRGERKSNAWKQEVVEQALEYIRFWQERLRLKDWVIDVVVRKPQKKENSFLTADVVYEPATRIARIRLYVDPSIKSEPTTSDAQEVYVLLQQANIFELERVILHELLHIMLAPLLPDVGTRSDAESLLLEQVINTLATALVELRKAAKE